MSRLARGIAVGPFRLAILPRERVVSAAAVRGSTSTRQALVKHSASTRQALAKHSLSTWQACLPACLPACRGRGRDTLLPALAAARCPGRGASERARERGLGPCDDDRLVSSRLAPFSKQEQARESKRPPPPPSKHASKQQPSQQASTTLIEEGRTASPLRKGEGSRCCPWRAVSCRG